MSPEEKKAFRAKFFKQDPKVTTDVPTETPGGETKTVTNTVNEASKITETTTETTSKAVTETVETTSKILAAADTLEAIGRVVAVAGIAGEAVAIVLQTAASATLYAEQAAYNDAFSTAVTKATKPLGISDLKTMMSTGEAMTYLMAAMSTGDPQALSTSFKANKPDMPLSQILAIEKNF
jgi:hypothetical protein